MFRRVGSILQETMAVVKITYSPCIRSHKVACSPPLFYPLPVDGLRFVMYIMRRPGATQTSHVPVAVELRKAGVIGDVCRKDRQPETFLLDRASPGSYVVKYGRPEDATVLVMICEYEQRHAGHRGCFASGYSYFLCGLLKPPAYQVMLRGTHAATDGPVAITVSRSYSGDCESVTPTRASNRAGQKSHGPSTNWRRPQAKESDPKEATSTNWRSAGKVSGPLPGAAALCKACGRREQVSMTALGRAGVYLQEHQFSTGMRLTEAVCASCEWGQALGSESSALQRSAQAAAKAAGRVRPANSTAKYVAQRHRLVSKYNGHLQLTEQAWFSICPEEIAKHIASRLSKLRQRLGRPLRVLEPFCGAGGNAVSCARMAEVEHVYAFDIDPAETRSARQMAELYNVQHKMTILTKDCLTLRPEDLPAQIDAVIFSPPWGGPEYQSSATYDLRAIQRPAAYDEILRHLAAFSRDMAVLMPRNSCLDQFAHSAERLGCSRIELEQNVLGGKIKTLTVYYGELAN